VEVQPPYLLFLGDARDDLAAKTARGIAQWRPEACLGQLRLPGCQADLGLPELGVVEAATRGARTLVVGVANAGGVLPESWLEVLRDALDAGLDLASGLHTRLGSFPVLREAAARSGRRLFDVRHSDRSFATGSGQRRPGRRLLTVGTDCSVGKKYTALALWRELEARGVAVDFRATGQTGILIAGRGVAIDAVPADFIAGAAEWLSPANDPEHWDVVEGQGSLFHPSFAGVSLGLLHGTQPDAFVVCHEPTRTRMRGVSHPLPEIGQVIEATLAAGTVTNPELRCVGIAVDTSRLGSPAARGELLERLAREYGLPCVDPLATGVAPIADRLLGGA
jgi:uncharacterized NAD-dependent epimerase/dehydratase family protein